MNKKLLSFLLAITLSLGTLVGCSSNTSEEDVEASADVEGSARVAMTLSLCLPTSKATTAEAADIVEAELNKLTRAKYDTAIDLTLIPEDEYAAYITAQLDGIKLRLEQLEAEEESKRAELKANKGESEETETETETEADETIQNEDGVEISAYPEVEENQFDIFLVKGYESYKTLIENEQLSALDSELTSTAKLLKSYIYPTFLSFANVGGTYAIPNNHPVGNYQYLLVNKELVEKYDYNPDDLTTLLKCQGFIKDIGFQKLDGVVPLLADAEAINMMYWSTDGEWSVMASQISNTMSNSTKCAPKNVFTNQAYINTIGMMKELNELGYVGNRELKDGEKFAVAVIEGDARIAEQYEEDYYVQFHAKPVFTDEDIYGSMFAVSAYTKNLSRAMEIVTYINTSEDIRTVLQYGKQGVHWDYEVEDSTDTIKIISKDYQMNMLDTGNVYMTYPGEGISMDEWKYGKQQNLDSIVSPYLKFPGYINELNAEKIKELDEISKDFKKRLDALTFAEFADGVNALKEEVKQIAVFDELMITKVENEDNPPEASVAYIYSKWYDEMYPHT